MGGNDPGSSVPIGSKYVYGLFTYTWLIFMVNVGIYIPYMDPMGYDKPSKKPGPPGSRSGLLMVQVALWWCNLRARSLAGMIGIPGAEY